MFANQYRNKKVLVTGHTGFKGTWLSFWLKELGAKVYGISLGEFTNPSGFKVVGLDTSLENTYLDIRDAKALKNRITEIKPDVVFHLAAEAIVHECYQHPAKAFETNLMGTVNVLEALRETPSVKAAVFVTSDKCYENVEWEYGYRETDHLGGSDPYSASKACAEIAISSYLRSYFQDSPTKACSARAGNVIGGGDWSPYRIIPDCIRAWAKNESVRIRNPQSTRPWQHVLEPLSGYLVLGQKLLENGVTFHNEPFNFGPQAQQNASVLELLEEIKRHWSQAKWEADVQTTHKKEANLLKLSIDKAIHHLDWLPTLDFFETVKMTSDWYENYYQKKDMVEVTRNQIAYYTGLARERKISWTRD